MLTEKKEISGSVELRAFTKYYGSGKNSVPACSEISLVFPENSITGLLGPNGAGKSTMLKALCGTHYATSGEVIVSGSLDPAFIREITGFVPEFPELDSSLTVKEVLYFEQILHNVPKDKKDELFEKAVKTMELSDVLNKKVSALSKGYLQRTSFAKVLAYDPKVLILDEFSGGLDPSQIMHLRKTIKKLSKTKTVILSTHHIEEAMSLCDTVYIVNHGKVVAGGTIDQIVKESGTKNLEEAFLRFTSTSDGE